MDRFRHAMALVFVVSMPGGLLYWFSVHPFIAFWRRRGPAATLGVHFTAMAALGGLAYRNREVLLAVEFGTHAAVVVASALVLLGSLALGVGVARQLPLRTMVGLPELAPGRFPQKLLTQGVYGWVRHPRYVELCAGMLAWALLTNFLACYALWLAGTAALAGVARLEERELRARFGAAYDEYARQVPRFLPRPGARHGLPSAT